MTAIEITGQTMNRITRMKIVTTQGVPLPGLASLRARRMDVYSETPATMTGSGTNIWPTVLSEAVNQALKMPPWDVSLKKARYEKSAYRFKR